MSKQLLLDLPVERIGTTRVVRISYVKNFASLWREGLSSEPLFYEQGGRPHDVHHAIPQGSDCVLVLSDAEHLPEEAEIPEAIWTTSPQDYLGALSWSSVWRLRFPVSGLRIIVQRRQHDDSTLLPILTPLLDRIEGGCFTQGVIPGVLLVSKDTPEDSIKTWIESPHTAPAQDHSSFPALRALLQASINTDPENHHSLSNIAGANLLKNAVPGAVGIRKTHSVEMAMSKLISSVTGCLTRDNEPENFTPERWAHGRDVPYVLLDDMAELWVPFLAGALGLQNVSDIRAPKVGTGNDGAALSLLEQKMRGWAQDPYQRRFLRLGDVAPGGDPNEAGVTDFVLFLDLRLFARAHESETAFTSKLLRIAELLKASCANGKERPPWPLIDGSRTGERGLNLLPRLLSLFDPTLPIVLFSSTDRKSIIEHLNHYANIVSDFQKPVFRHALGDASNYVGLCRQRFEAAMNRAQGIRRTRTTLKRLSSL